MARMPQVYEKYPDESLWATVSFKTRLLNGDLLTGTPTVTECSGTLYFSNIQINTSTMILASGTDYEETVSSGEAVQFLVASGDAGSSYDMVVSCSTDGNIAPSQDMTNVAQIDVIRTTKN